MKDETKKDDKPGENDPIEELKKQKEEYLNGWKRERADFLNYKKNEMERIGELIKYANEAIIIKMLPILDNLMIAEKSIAEELKKDENIKGLLQINQQIKDFLKTLGIEEIKTIGEKFNPNFHEAIGEAEDKDKEQGIVIEETQKGYTMYGGVIRPAKVKINK